MPVAHHHPARDFVNLLQQLGGREMSPDEAHNFNRRVHASLNRFVDSALADRFEYTRVEIEWYDRGPKPIQGLALANSRLMVAEILGLLGRAKDETLVELFDPLGLSAAQGRAALHVAFWIMACLQWESRDRTIEHTWTDDARERYIAATLRSLQCFRETGEP